MTLSTSIKTLAFASLLALAPAQMMAAQKGGTFTTGDKTFLPVSYTHLTLPTILLV